MISTTKTNHNVTLKCEILKEDFDEMIYFFESGIFDLTTKNSAALALRRAVGPGHKVKIKRDGHNGPFRCFVDGQKFVPSRDMEDLFEAAEHGEYLAGYQFEVVIPLSFLGLGA